MRVRPQPEEQRINLYLGEREIEQLRAESERQGRSLSWIVRRAIDVAMPTIRQFPDDPGVRA